MLTVTKFDSWVSENDHNLLNAETNEFTVSEIQLENPLIFYNAINFKNNLHVVHFKYYKSQ